MPDNSGATGSGVQAGTVGQQNNQGQQSNQQQQGDGTSQGAGANAPGTLTYDSWLAQQPDDIKGLVESNITGLRSALHSERQQRQQLAEQLREAAKGATGEAKVALDKMGADLEAAQRRADFFEEAARPEVGCTNPRLAFLAAEQAGLIDKRGRVDWDTMRQQYPELFRQAGATRGSADGGAGGARGATGSMNDYIRRFAGR
jgi:hypothetical protein